MNWALDPAAGQCVEARRIDIDQSRRARHWRFFRGAHHLRVYSPAPDFETCPAWVPAKAIGVTRQTIISIEKGHFVPSTLLTLKLARYSAAETTY
jgi:hypothetical protein